MPGAGCRPVSNLPAGGAAVFQPPTANKPGASVGGGTFEKDLNIRRRPGIRNSSQWDFPGRYITCYTLRAAGWIDDERTFKNKMENVAQASGGTAHGLKEHDHRLIRHGVSASCVQMAAGTC
ncbi:hypothetical protein EYF80_018941 [Liparis tanakae]|uniref:Uncharacterized protein n=1 Tax=Liparis tanakae TaxID=230148 RepID=A0A4Z2HYK5_9TELE|nr:hypothetical protein EYF80_018941 [Liparis tanakae]